MSATTLRAGGDRQSLLKRSLLADAAFSGTTGIILIAGAGVLAETFGLPSMLLRIVGVSLIPFSAALLFVVSRLDRARPFIWAVVGGNLLWAVASALLLLTGWVEPTTMGLVFILGQAAAVAGFAEIQFFGLRRLG